MKEDNILLTRHLLYDTININIDVPSIILGLLGTRAASKRKLRHGIS